ncbi:hypothetical protein [Pseudonocardia charpentierae]|uniref:hypothetical protein n=1 Tax=Pseudonocardia charpentierae TaxID=3075545 RepID=UPI0037C6BC8C
MTDLPDDIGFVLALHEGSVVGAATEYATARERPALVNLHTTAGRSSRRPRSSHDPCSRRHA